MTKNQDKIPPLFKVLSKIIFPLRKKMKHYAFDSTKCNVKNNYNIKLRGQMIQILTE